MSPKLSNPPLDEADTRSKLIDPAIYARGWTEGYIRRIRRGAVHKKHNSQENG